MSAPRTLVRSVLRTMTASVPRALAAGGFLLVSGGALASAQTASQVVRFRVIAQSHAEVAPVLKPISMVRTNGGISTSALTLATNQANLKVTASLDQPMPAGTSLSLTVGKAAEGRGASVQQLGTDATDVLNGMAPTIVAQIPVSYRVAGTGDRPPRAAEQRLVTYTILSAP